MPLDTQTSSSSSVPTRVTISADSPECLDSFIAELGSMTSVAGLNGVLSAFLKQHGAGFYSYHLVKLTGSNERLACFVSDFPERWMKRYFDRRLIDDDPVVDEILRRDTPFLWDEAVDPRDLGRRQQSVLDDAAAHGISGGFTMPLTGYGTEKAALSVIVDRKPDAMERLLRKRHTIHLFAMFFHRAAAGMLINSSLTANSARRRSILTPREREVVEWTARGRSASEIAICLNISERSVQFHSENVKRKLQVYNRTHAVAKAMALGLITV